MRILHCSDVHITGDYSRIPFLRLGWRRWIALMELKYGGRERAYRQARETLRQIVRDFHARGADHLILSGDLTAYALEEEFQGAREALGELADDPRRCTVIPGNHDVYTPGSHRSRRFERHFGQLIQSDLPEYCRDGAYPFVRLLGESVAVVGLISARVPRAPGFSHGWLGQEQLAGLRDLVSDARVRERAVVVVVHHAPLGHHGRPDRLMHGLRDRRALFRTIPGPRFAVLHGHIHRRYHHPATPERPHLFGAGSSTQGGHEGYWMIDVRDGKISGQMHPVVREPAAPGRPAAASASA